MWSLHCNQVLKGNLECTGSEVQYWKISTDKFIILKYFELKMEDNLPILDQLHELQVGK
jgi:hypothetical protein